MKRPNRTYLAVLATVLAMLVIWIASSALHTGPASQDALPAPTEALASGPAPSEAETDARGVPLARERPSCYLGVLASRGATDLLARTAGTLGPLRVNLGDRVSRGQELARVESASSGPRLDEQSARLDAARTALLAADVEVKRASRELERRQGAPDLFSTEQIEGAEFQLELSQLERQSRQADIALAEAALARVTGEQTDTVLRAPFDATVSAVYTVPGTAVEPGRQILRLLANENPIVRFAVPAGDASEFPVGTVVSAEVTEGRHQASAIVETLAPALDPATQLIFIEASSTAEAWDEVPRGANLRVTPSGHGSCRDQPVAMLPQEST